MKQTYGNSITVMQTGARAVVRFDRGANRNAIDQDALLALTEVAHDLADDIDIHTVVLRGADDIFSAGIDLKDPQKWQEENEALLVRRAMAQRGARLCHLWESLPQLTVASIEGAAVGGSVALALACDWRVMSEDAFFYLPETKVGLNMGWGAIPRVVALVGPARAKRMILTAQRMPGQQALDWGLADALTAPGDAEKEAHALLDAASVTPPALMRMTKEAINANATALNHLGIYMDADQALVCRDSTEGKAARDAFLK